MRNHLILTLTLDWMRNPFIIWSDRITKEINISLPINIDYKKILIGDISMIYLVEVHISSTFSLNGDWRVSWNLFRSCANVFSYKYLSWEGKIINSLQMHFFYLRHFNIMKTMPKLLLPMNMLSNWMAKMKMHGTIKINYLVIYVQLPIWSHAKFV